MPVLYVLCLSNYNEAQGMLLNTSAFSAYPSESELILVEGIEVYILGIEESFEIENESSPFMEKFNGKMMTIVYFM